MYDWGFTQENDKQTNAYFSKIPTVYKSQYIKKMDIS